MKVIETHEYNNSDHEDVSGVEISIVTDDGHYFGQSVRQE